MSNSKPYVLDTWKNKPLMIEVKQNDSDRTLVFNLKAGGSPINLAGKTIQYYVEKTDNTVVYNNGTITDAVNGVVGCKLTAQSLSVAGTQKLEISTIGSGGTETTFTVYLIVTAGIDQSGAVQSSSEFGALVQATSDINSVKSKLPDNVINVKEYGAKGDGVTDDTAAIQAAINAAPNGSTILIGTHRLHGGLTVNKILKFKGYSFINANYTGAYATSKFYFDVGTVPICITATTNICFEDMVVTGSNQALGISISSGSLSLNNAVIQSFQQLIAQANGYYTKWVNSYLGFCDYAATFDNCYNINFVNMSINSNISPIKLNNSSNLTIHGGSIEGFYSYGIEVHSSSRVNLFGTYFEGTTYINNNSCVSLDASCACMAIGCHVYLTRTSHFIYSVADNVRIFSRNNTFVYPTDTTAVIVYSYLSNLTASTIDIAGDNWSASAGVNVTYCTLGMFSQGALYEIVFPFAHPNFGKNVSTKNSFQTLSKVTPTVSDGTIVNFANAGNGTDDPLGIHTKAWGYNAYRAIYQKGQWEKVGARLPNQVDSVATDVTTLKNDFNALLQKLRDNGIMI